MLEPDKRTPPPLQALMVVLGSVFFSIIQQVLIITAFPGEKEGSLDPLGLKLSLVVGELCLIIIPLIYINNKNYLIKDIFRWRKVPLNILLVSVPVGLGLSIVVDELDRLVQLIFPMPEELNSEIMKTMSVTNGLDLLLLVLSAVILAAVIEEAIFRGFLQQSIEEHADVTQAVIFSSLAWAFIHLNPYTMAQLFVFGFFLGFISWRTASIIPAIICHGINNLLALIYYNIDVPEQLPYYEWHGHVSPILLLAAIFVTFKGIQYIDRFYQIPPSSNTISSE
jgi:membrane protease YdiL (CAAX protease family)